MSICSIGHSSPSFKKYSVSERFPLYFYQLVYSSSPLNPTLFPQRLANSKAHTSRFISANLPCNKFKNRLVNIMPFESTRVCLQPIRGVEGSDYINASCIDGYRYLPIPNRYKKMEEHVCFNSQGLD